MKQLLLWQWSVATSTSSLYLRPFFNRGTTGTSARSFLMPVEATLSNLCVEMTNWPWVWNDVTFTMYAWPIGRDSTALSVTVSWTDTMGENTTNSVVIPAWDSIQLFIDNPTRADLWLLRYSVDCEPTVDQTFVISWNTSGNASAWTRYVSVNWWWATFANALDAWTYVPINCTVKGIGVDLNSSTTGDYTFDLVKNGSVVASTTVVLDSSSTDNFEYLWWLNADISAWDFIALRYITNGATARIISTAVVIEPDVTNEFFMSASSVGSIFNSTRYAAFYWTHTSAPTTTESPQLIWLTDLLVKGMRVSIGTAPWAWTRSFELVKNSIVQSTSVDLTWTNTSGISTEDVLFTKWDTIESVWSRSWSVANTADVHCSIVVAVPWWWEPPVSVSWGNFLHFF